MNSLSWALYAAGAFDSLKILLIFLAVIFGPIWFGVVAFQRDNCDLALRPSAPLPWPKAGALASVLLACVSCALPSAKTVYLIAASEAGERVANSPEGREMLDLIRRKIRDMLTDKA